MGIPEFVFNPRRTPQFLTLRYHGEVARYRTPSTEGFRLLTDDGTL